MRWNWRLAGQIFDRPNLSRALLVNDPPACRHSHRESRLIRWSEPFSAETLNPFFDKAEGERGWRQCRPLDLPEEAQREAPALAADVTVGLGQPYPGCGPFEPHEALKFYGRETHTAELLRNLAQNSFHSGHRQFGTGKSSLVRAGLLPALHRGRLAGATSQWRICIHAAGRCADEEPGEIAGGQKIFSGDPSAVQKELGTIQPGLAGLARKGGLAAGENLLLVVDQFEELFRLCASGRSRMGAPKRGSSWRR